MQPRLSAADSAVPHPTCGALKRPRRRRRDSGGRRSRQVAVRFTPAEHDRVVRHAAEAGLAAGAWLGELAIRHLHQPQIPTAWHDLLREFMQLRVEVARTFGDGEDRSRNDDSSSQMSDKQSELIGAAERVLDELDTLIEQVGRRIVRDRS